MGPRPPRAWFTRRPDWARLAGSREELTWTRWWASSASASWAAPWRATSRRPAGGWSATTTEPAAAPRWPRRGSTIAADAARRGRGRRHSTQPADAAAPLPATAAAIAAAGRTAAPSSRPARCTLDDKRRPRRVLRAAGHTAAGLPALRHRRAGECQGHRGLCQRRPAAIERSARSSRLRARRTTTSAPSATAAKMKFVANLLVAIHNVAAAEAMVLGMKAGLDPKRIFEVVSHRRRHLARLRAARRR